MSLDTEAFQADPGFDAAAGEVEAFAQDFLEVAGRDDLVNELVFTLEGAVEEVGAAFAGVDADFRGAQLFAAEALEEGDRALELLDLAFEEAAEGDGVVGLVDVSGFASRDGDEAGLGETLEDGLRGRDGDLGRFGERGGGGLSESEELEIDGLFLVAEAEPFEGFADLLLLAGSEVNEGHKNEEFRRK